MERITKKEYIDRMLEVAGCIMDEVKYLISEIVYLEDEEIDNFEVLADRVLDAGENTESNIKALFADFYKENEACLEETKPLRDVDDAD